jgi:hypothetical protein
MNRPEPGLQRLGRWTLALTYAAAGVIHLVKPAPFAAITPAWVPQPDKVVALTGVAELLGAVGLVQPVSPRLRRAAGWGWRSMPCASGRRISGTWRSIWRGPIGGWASAIISPACSHSR